MYKVLDWKVNLGLNRIKVYWSGISNGYNSILLDVNRMRVVNLKSINQIRDFTIVSVNINV